MLYSVVLRESDAYLEQFQTKKSMFTAVVSLTVPMSS